MTGRERRHGGVRSETTRRLWWLLGGGAAAVAAAVAAIVVLALSPSEGAPVARGQAELAPAGAHAIGDPDAPVTLVEFFSFTCPACAYFTLGVEPEIIEKYVRPGKVRIVYRVLGVGVESELAAEAAECAGAQGRFDAYHRALFELLLSPNPPAFSRENLESLARGMRLDGIAFSECLRRGEYASRLQAEREAAGALGVEYTPTMFVNGEKIVGLMSFEVYERAIEKALAEAE